MKKIITIIMLMFCILSINAQTSDSIQFYRTICECCHEFQDGYVVEYKHSLNTNDTILFFSKINIYNDIIDKNYNLLHYDVGNYQNEKELNLNTLKVFDNDLSIKKICSLYNYNVLNEISKDFKFGFIDNYEWSTNSVNGINFKISYTNTNKKTIKYIDIYFIIKNPVGDICKLQYNKGSNIGHLKCVGPIEQFDTAKYSWDAVYYTTGDASNLHLQKIVLTFMDNTKYTLAKEISYKN